MTYYKGEIITAENIYDKEKTYLYGYVETDYYVGPQYISNSDFSLNINQLSSEERRDLSDFNDQLYSKLNRTEKLVFNAEANPLIYKILNKLVPDYETYYFKSNALQVIIFEIVKDSYGNKYGKELITGLIFPLYTNINNYSFIRRPGKKDSIYITNEKETKILETFDKQEIIIGGAKVADNNEVKEYLEQFDKGLFKEKKKEKFINELTHLYGRNVFNDKFVIEEKKEKVREVQNTETKVMEDIEFLLQKLSFIDTDLYNTYLNKYNKLISGDFDYKALAIIEGELEFHLMMGKKKSINIDEYLENLKKESLGEILSNEVMKEEISIEKIDKLEETFLKTKDQYTLLVQRKTLKDLSFLYLLELCKKRENEEELKNSYIVDNLKTIIIIIKSLINLGIIKNNAAIEINGEVTLNNVLQIIDKIEFNKESKEDINELIKHI